MRVKDGIYGNISEFDLFRKVFGVIPGTPFWVPPPEVIQKATGRDDGEIGQQENFPRLINHARKLIAYSNQQLK